MLGADHIPSQRLLGGHMLFCESEAVPFLALLYCNGRLLTNMLPPLFCRDQLVHIHFLHEKGDIGAQSLEVQVLEVCHPWRGQSKSTKRQFNLSLYLDKDVSCYDKEEPQTFVTSVHMECIMKIIKTA